MTGACYYKQIDCPVAANLYCIQYDWRDMPVKFSFYELSAYSGTLRSVADVRTLETTESSKTDVNITYDASGNRVKKETADNTAIANGQYGASSAQSGDISLTIGSGSNTPVAFNSGGSIVGSHTSSPLTGTPPHGALVLTYTNNGGTTHEEAVFTANGPVNIDFNGTVTQQSTLTTESEGNLTLLFTNANGSFVTPAALSIDQLGDADLPGLTISTPFSSGVAYVDNNYIFTTNSGINAYARDYALFGGEGKEEFGSPNLFRYYLKDHLGSTRAVWAPDVGSGQLVEATGYLPYGIQVAIITPTANEAAREKFTGKELDKDGVGTDLADAGSNDVTGVQLNYFGKRYYDAEIGRWVGCDPAKEFWDSYRYTINPIGHFDPNGAVDASGSLGVKGGLLIEGGASNATFSINLNSFLNEAASENPLAAPILLPIIGLLNLFDSWASFGQVSNRSNEESASGTATVTESRGPQFGGEVNETLSATVGGSGNKTYGVTLSGAAGWLGLIAKFSLNFNDGNNIPVGFNYSFGAAQGSYVGATYDKTSTVASKPINP